MHEYTAHNIKPETLSEPHSVSLQQGSGIRPDVIAERGVRTVGRFSEVPAVFSRKQRRKVPGILFTVHRPNGETRLVLRPDEADPDQPGRKYEQPPKRGEGPGNVLDVHPSLHGRADDLGVPVLFTEGIKKADSITSAARREGVGVLTVGISGTWNWMSGGEPIPDMFDIPVKGRRVLICFDSDMLRNPNVQMAAERLAEHLGNRGAGVEMIYLPDAPDGSKVGADDFLAGGGTLSGLLALARPYSSGELQREKLSRNGRLRRSLEHLRGLADEMPAKTRRDCSKLAAWRACCAMAEGRGKLAQGGVEFVGSSMMGAELAHMSQPTFSACMREFEESGLVERIKSTGSDHADSYVMRVPGGVSRYNDGGGRGKGAEEGRDTEGVNPRYKEIPPLPEVRWSTPGSRRRVRGVVPGTRRVRQGVPAGDSGPQMRPGKKRDEIVRYVLTNGGAATREELLERFGGKKTAWRDFKRQVLSVLLGRQRRHRDTPLSVGPPVIELTGDGVRLVEGWEDAWAKHRILSEEDEASRKQQRDHLDRRMGYRHYLARREEDAARRKHGLRVRAGMIVDALVDLFAKDPDNRDLFPDEMAEAVARLVPEDFPRDVEPFGKPRPEEIVLFLEGHDMPIPTPIYDRFDRDAEARFRAWERAARRSGISDKPEPVVEASPMKRRRLTVEEAEEVKRLMSRPGVGASEARAAVLGEGG
ncbi:MAG: DUF3854 domain-containing protein [Rubrobacteraceae bacterium]